MNEERTFCLLCYGNSGVKKLSDNNQKSETPTGFLGAYKTKSKWVTWSLSEIKNK